MSTKKRYCVNCGYKIDVETVFCPVCAFKVGDPVYEKKKMTLKSKVVIGAIVALIVLGAIGSLLPRKPIFNEEVAFYRDKGYSIDLCRRTGLKEMAILYTRLPLNDCAK